MEGGSAIRTYQITLTLSGVLNHAVPSIVARVRPRTSKGITDLLLLYLVLLTTASPSKKRFLLELTYPRACDATREEPTPPDGGKGKSPWKSRTYLAGQSLVRYRN